MNTKNPLLIAVVGFALAGLRLLQLRASSRSRRRPTTSRRKVDDGAGRARRRPRAARLQPAGAQDLPRGLLDGRPARQGRPGRRRRPLAGRPARPGRQEDPRRLPVDRGRQRPGVGGRVYVDRADRRRRGSCRPARPSAPPASRSCPSPSPSAAASSAWASSSQRLDAFVKANNDQGRRDRPPADGRRRSSSSPTRPASRTSRPPSQATSYLVSPLEGATGGATPAGPAGAAGRCGARRPASTTPPTTTASHPMNPRRSLQAARRAQALADRAAPGRRAGRGALPALKRRGGGRRRCRRRRPCRAGRRRRRTSVVTLADADKRDEVRAVLGDRKDPFRPAQITASRRPRTRSTDTATSVDAGATPAAAPTAGGGGTGAEPTAPPTATVPDDPEAPEDDLRPLLAAGALRQHRRRRAR